MAYKKGSGTKRAKKGKTVQPTEDATKGKKKGLLGQMTGLMSKSSRKHPML